MERTFKQRGDVEAVKTTMLKQEEIFKQQVRELHRLYSVQRMLMEEAKRELIQRSKYSKTLITTTCCSHGSCSSGGNSETRIVTAKRNLGFGLDLTLSIGSGGGGAKKRLKDDQCRGLECSDARKLDQKGQELQLLPCLSTVTNSKGTQSLRDEGEERPYWKS